MAFAQSSALMAWAAALSACFDVGAAQTTVPGVVPTSLRGAGAAAAPGGSGDLAKAAAKVPAWCSFVPDPFKGVACGSSSSAQQGAEPAQAPQNPASQEVTVNGTVPAWCEFVPSPFQSVACTGSGRSCQCADRCSSTSVESRRWNPECCGCSSDLPGPSEPEAGGETCADASAECGAWAKAGQCGANPSYMHESCKLSCGLCGTASRSSGSAEKGSTVPSWCQFVPDALQGAACR